MRALAALAVLFLLASCTVSGGSGGRAALAGPPAAVRHEAGPPAADSAWKEERHVRELLHQAETWRGLRAKRRIQSRMLAEKDLAKVVAESFRDDMPAGTLRSMEAAFKAFGLIPESLDLETFLPRLLTQQIAGYYDPEENALNVILRDGGVLGGHEEEAGIDSQRAEDMVLVHELTHALQDQHFDLATFVETSDPMSDETTARQALVEGDATLTMLDALLGIPVEELPGAEDLLGAPLGASEELLAGGDQELFSQAPPFIRETLLFSYAQGNIFCISVRRKGGQKLLDHAFRSDPPRSSEQILHPEKWHGRRDDPVAVEWPDLAGTLPGFTKAAEGEMGELAIRILLREGLGDEARAEKAAAGWGGDRFAVYQQGDTKAGRRLLAWITEWDSAQDATELAAAVRQLGAGWRTEGPGEGAAAKRVIVLKGDITPRQATALLERLGKARIQRPANRAIDLAALGIRDEDRAGADPEKLRKLLEDPALRQRLEGLTGVTPPPEDQPPGDHEEDSSGPTPPPRSSRSS